LVCFIKGSVKHILYRIIDKTSPICHRKSKKSHEIYLLIMLSTKFRSPTVSAAVRAAHWYSFSPTIKNVHSSAVKGFTADSAELYNAGRPTYPRESLIKMLEVIKTVKKQDTQLKFLELGAGTGKFTKTFLEFCSSKEALQLLPTLNSMVYTATEPSIGFRSSLSEQIRHPALDVQSAIGSDIPSNSHSLDAIFVAQAFHWMATEDTLQEVHRVLAPGSPLILVWNTYDYSLDWQRELDEQVLTPAYNGMPGVPRQQNGKWEECFHSATGKNAFSALQKWEGRNVHSGDKQLVVDRIMSTSVIAEKDAKDKEAIERTVRNILDTHPSLKASRESGKFGIAYVTEIAWTTAV
jgi:SAM-dependent methyltransferase